MIMDDNDGQMIFGDLGGQKLPDICLTGEEKLRNKNRTQETCPDWGSNSGPLPPVPRRWTGCLATETSRPSPAHKLTGCFIVFNGFNKFTQS